MTLTLTDLRSAFGWQQYHYQRNREWENAVELPKRLLRLMRSYYEDASQRIAEQNHKRFMYEESPHYETGYLMHELIERYKKMVMQMDRLVKFKSNSVFDCIERTELIQKLYFEIYHIVNMLHELPIKWKHIGEFGKRTERTPVNITDAMKSAAQGKLAEEKRQKRADKERKKLLKKRREMMIKGLLVFTERPASAKRVPYNPHWPIDYGWEIDDF